MDIQIFETVIIRFICDGWCYCVPCTNLICKQIIHIRQQYFWHMEIMENGFIFRSTWELKTLNVIRIFASLTCLMSLFVQCLCFVTKHQYTILACFVWSSMTKLPWPKAVLTDSITVVAKQGFLHEWIVCFKQLHIVGTELGVFLKLLADFL